jgi:hypothetical protein
MARKKRRFVVYTEPPLAAPSAPPPPAAAGAKTFDLFDTILKAVMIGAAIVGLITVGWWIDGVRHPLPEPGLVCWKIERATSACVTYSTRCDVADGWHIEDWHCRPPG